MDRNRSKIIIFLLVLVAIIFVDILLVIYRQRITPTPIPSPVSTPTLTPTTWKTYQNETYSFQYPDTVFVEKGITEDVVVWKDKNKPTQPQMHFNPGIYFIIKTANLNDVYDQEIIDAITGKNPEMSKLFKLKIIKMGNNNAYFLNTDGEGEGIFVYAFSKQNKYILFESQQSKYTIESDSVYNQILSTFKFLDNPDLTSTWKTYENKKYGFSFKYPPYYRTKGDDQEVWFMDESTEGETRGSFVSTTKDGLSLKEYLAQLSNPTDGKDIYNLKYQRVKFGNNEFTQINYSQGGSEVIFPAEEYAIEHNNNIILLLNTNALKSFNQVLSTFKFLDNPDPTSTWKTYENKELGFSFEFPGSFGYKDQFVHGEVGDDFRFHFDQFPEDFDLSSESFDYVSGRSGFFSDSKGYEEKDGKIYFILASDKKYEIPSRLIKRKFTNEFGVEVVVVEGEDYSDGPYNGPREGTPGEGNIGILINSKNSEYPGITITINQSSQLAQTAVLDKLLSTFQLYSPVDPVQSWKLYQNDQYQFSFKHPPYISLRSTSTECGQGEISCFIFDGDNGNYLNVIVKDVRFSSPSYKDFSPLVEITNGVGHDTGSTGYDFVRKDQQLIVNLSYNKPNTRELPLDTEIIHDFSKLIRTFKFL